MAASSNSVVAIDPDGDLILLLELMPVHKSDESSSQPQINFSNANVLNPEAANSPVETQNECTQLHRCKIMVSSKHMSFASPVFKAMLTGDFKEAVEVREKGRTEIPLPDDDACAMIIVVNIMHGRFKSVPKYLNLVMFSKIAILVDKYQCHESTEFAAKIWTANHRPLSWSRSWYNTACLLCVAWVFGIDDEFIKATEKIIRESGVSLGAILTENNLTLPIPERVINKIDESRENAVSQLIDVLKDTIYSRPTCRMRSNFVTMAESSKANVIVDPDGDLILLLNSNISSSSKSDDYFSTDPEAVNTSDDDILSESKITRSVEVKLSDDEPSPTYHDRLLVSSKHMSLGSPVFRAMLQGEFKEAVTLKTVGKLEVPLPDDHPSAMKILINIIHGRMNMVPLNIELELFTQIAILVDKYQCRETLRFLFPVWKNGLSDTFSEPSWTNIARWVCIAWQFELEDEFIKATQMIREKSDRSLESLMDSIKYDLPIPKYVVDKLESCRLEGIRKAVKILQETITEYQSVSRKCSATEVPKVVDSSGNRRSIDNDLSTHRNDCDSMVLGSIIKSAVSNGLYPLPKQPYTSWSLESLTAKVNLLTADSLCFKYTKEELEDHNVIGNIKEFIKAIDKSGLTLAACKDLALC
ncbi:hypothetical protein BHYA_0069g00130 [Botrytis hyacinthi]|uniref:BTB domain-containing protein n=1 Tax=Botrytis hyacinthi TaxID=278943 RepID=A0A4Z1GP30_9HELO|nr:hypothetical protein BHYA_0069g00130 [Botrytis hyacinthi]